MVTLLFSTYIKCSHLYFETKDAALSAIGVFDAANLDGLAKYGQQIDRMLDNVSKTRSILTVRSWSLFDTNPVWIRFLLNARR